MFWSCMLEYGTEAWLLVSTPASLCAPGVVQRTAGNRTITVLTTWPTGASPKSPECVTLEVLPLQ